MPTSDAAPAWGPWLITLLIYPGGLFALAQGFWLASKMQQTESQ